MEKKIKKKHRWVKYLLIGCIGVVIALCVAAWAAIRFLSPEDILTSPFVQQQIKKQLGEETVAPDIFSYIPTMLGFSSPKTYLVLFLNNTELRPGGGFIGSYAVIKMEHGIPHVLKVEGTEILDRQAPAAWQSTPPTPIQQYLGVDRWYFRDSNWSPDFAESSKQGLEFYEIEGGLESANIDAVIGITPTVLERLIDITGPLVVNGITFTSENLIETLEYEVEIGFVQKGITRENRKDLISDVLHELLRKTESHAITNISVYLPTMVQLLNEKQVIVYNKDIGLQQVFEKEGWTGSIEQASLDYLTWIDANLGALKTDHAIERDIAYELRKTAEQQYVGTATMTYQHNGTFDWRTTRYLSYARVYVPIGATLVSVDTTLQSEKTSIPLNTVDQGEELGKQWFGFFISVEPGQTKRVAVQYMLPESLAQQITAKKEYNILVQKQIGTTNLGLTLDIQFDTNIENAVPAEAEEYWGDAVYYLQTDLTRDKDVSITLK